VGAEDARAEFDLSIERLYLYAAWADKWDGDVHRTPMRNVTLAMREPVGVMGVVCPDEAPVLGFISTVMPALALGNRVVAVPSEPWPLMATDLYQVFETSDVPAGAINIVTGTKEELVPVLAAHDDVEGIWYWGSGEGSGEVERLAAGNMKRCWVDYGEGRDWFSAGAAGREFLRHATEIRIFGCRTGIEWKRPARVRGHARGPEAPSFLAIATWSLSKNHGGVTHTE
jgi:aldehyde dehydrogenase (NAD+)